VCREQVQYGGYKQIHWRSIRIPNDLRCFRHPERAGFAGPVRPANCDQVWTTPEGYKPKRSKLATPKLGALTFHLIERIPSTVPDFNFLLPSDCSLSLRGLDKWFFLVRGAYQRNTTLE